MYDMVHSQYDKNDDQQNDQGHGADNKIEVSAPKRYFATGPGSTQASALLFHALLAAFDALAALILNRLRFIIAGTRAQVLHAAAHIAIIALHLLLSGIRICWYLFGLR
jgi:uncharacterized ferritin-like protein (DUF455 family)